MSGHENSTRLIQCEILQEEGGNPSFGTILRKVRTRTIIGDGLSEIITKLTVFGFQQFGVAWLSELCGQIDEIENEFIPRPPPKKTAVRKKSKTNRRHQPTAGQQPGTNDAPGAEGVEEEQETASIDAVDNIREVDSNGDVDMNGPVQEVGTSTDSPLAEEGMTAMISDRQHAEVGDGAHVDTTIDANLSHQQLELIARSAYQLSTDAARAGPGEQSIQVGELQPPSAISAPPSSTPMPSSDHGDRSERISQTISNGSDGDDDRRATFDDVDPAGVREDRNLTTVTDPLRHAEDLTVNTTSNRSAAAAQSLRGADTDSTILPGHRKRTIAEVMGDEHADRGACDLDRAAKKTRQSEDQVLKVRSYKLVLAGGTAVGRDIDERIMATPSCANFLRSLSANGDLDGVRFEDLANAILHNYCDLLRPSSTVENAENKGRKGVQAVSQPAFTLLLNAILGIFRPDTLVYRIREQLDAFRDFVKLSASQNGSTTYTQLQDLSPLLRRLSIASRWMAVSSQSHTTPCVEAVTIAHSDYVAQSGRLCQQIHSLECHTKVSGFLLAMKCFQLAETFDKILEESQLQRNESGTGPDLGSGQGLKTYAKHLIIKSYRGTEADLSRNKTTRRYTDPKTMDFSNKLNHYLETGRFAQEMVKIPGRDRNIGMLLLWPVKPDGSSALSSNNVKAGSRHVLQVAMTTISQQLPRVMDIISRLGTIVSRIIELPDYPRTIVEMDAWDDVSHVAKWQDVMALLQEDPNSPTQPQWNVTPQKTRAGLWNSEIGAIEHSANNNTEAVQKE